MMMYRVRLTNAQRAASSPIAQVELAALGPLHAVRSLLDAMLDCPGGADLTGSQPVLIEVHTLL